MRRSHIYVLKVWVPAGTPVRSPESNASYKILDTHYTDLPSGARKDFDRLLAAEAREHVEIRYWAKQFISAYDAGDPLPQRNLGSTVSVDTSTLKGAEDLSSMGRALLAVLDAGARGVTSIEARKMGERGGGISGALTKLHQAGVISCLEARR